MASKPSIISTAQIKNVGWCLFIKKLFINGFLLFTFALLLNTGASAVDISASHAVVYEPQTQTVLYEKDSDCRQLIASTTKIMTALIVLENCELDEVAEITWEQASVEGSSAYLKPGESYTVEQLLYGLLLMSGNDAATALAEHTAGSMEDFAKLMNEKCAQLGLENTHFVNSHGLDADDHYSSAYDLAVITAAAMENEIFCEIFGSQSYKLEELTYTNHNKLLKLCDGCIGGKTGYTLAAGRCLVSVVERDGMRLICVTITAPDDWNDHCELYDWAYGSYEYVPVLTENITRIPVVSGTSEYVDLKSEKDGFLISRDSKVSRKVCLPQFVFAPVTAGESAGTIDFYVDGELYESVEIIYDGTVFVDKSNLLTPWEKFKRAWYLSNKYGVYYPAY